MKNKQFINIAGRRIACDQPPYIVAELSANHNGKIETAIQIITEAKAAGASAVKLQTYTPDTITLNCSTDDFKISSGLWSGKNLYELYQSAHLPWDWHKDLFEHANKIGLTIFSSPFDKTAVDFLEDLNVPAYKIASFEAIDLPLIEYAAKTGKPLIISTGMANAVEIQDALDAARSGGCKELALLHCVSGYPAPADDYNLLTIPDMIDRFDVVVGLSDHTLSNTTAITSVALGACIIEKHFTLNRNGGGPDDSFSMEPQDLRELCDGSYASWSALGRINYDRKTSELENLKFRRSLYFVRELNSGDIISRDDVRSVRPGYGLPPKDLEKVIGRRVTTKVKYGDPVSWNVIK